MKLKIYQMCPFYNENLVANINIVESSKYVEKFYITESNRNFHYVEKPYNFEKMFEFDDNILSYEKINCDKNYASSDFIGKLKLVKYRFSKDKYKKKLLASPTWFNEAVQRNSSCSWIHPNDEDIIILADIDEIIDSRYIDEIVEEVKKREIVTFKIHFTLFYLNLFSKNWGGPSGYSYRIFVMTGKFFNQMKYTSDELRKLGEKGALANDVYCIDKYLGFHHSWLGDEKFILNKINSYAHTEHQQFANIDHIRECLKNRQSIFPNHEVEVINDIEFIRTIENIKKDKLKNYFL